MRIALVGADGQLGRELQRRLSGEIVALGHTDIELTDAENVEAAVANAEADLVINAAAYNQVDRAEAEPDLAFAANALGPRHLAIACQSRDIPLLHVSSDYVFSGRIQFGGVTFPRTVPYREFDRPDPVSAYGVSKLAGELFVRSLCRKHFVLRTSGLYGETASPDGGNFVRTMLRLGRERDEVRVVDDQTLGPTSTADLAAAIESLIATESYGLYHATNAGSVTWCGFAREVFRLAKIDAAVQAIRTAEFGAAAARPAYSVLDCRKLAAATGFEFSPWQDALTRYLREGS